MPNFADIMKKIAEVGAHIAEVAAEHPEATVAIAQMVEAALAGAKAAGK